jgi:peroxiredoxin
MMPGGQAVLGQAVDDFELTDSAGAAHRLSQYRGAVAALTFWSAECPVAREYDPYFNGLLDRYPDGRVVVLGIDSNVHYGLEEIVRVMAERGVRFPVLRDAGCAIADYFGAQTTPHVFIVDAEGRLAYAGAVDDRTFRQRQATVNYVDQALEALLAGQTPPAVQTQPYGCTIVRMR